LNLASISQNLITFTHIVILGGPMNVYEEARYPFLRMEDFFIKEAIQRGKSILGISWGTIDREGARSKSFQSPVKEIGCMTFP